MRLDNRGETTGFILALILSILSMVAYIYFIIGWLFKNLVASITIGSVVAYSIGFILSLIGIFFLAVGCICLLAIGVDW